MKQGVMMLVGLKVEMNIQWKTFNPFGTNTTHNSKFKNHHKTSVQSAMCYLIQNTVVLETIMVMELLVITIVMRRKRATKQCSGAKKNWNEQSKLHMCHYQA
jgi:hypothetical protein